MLSDRDIETAIETGRIIINPMPASKQFDSCSIDFRLGAEFLTFDRTGYTLLDTRPGMDISSCMTKLYIAEGSPLIIHPGDFLLAVTIESLILADDITARLEGRSSLARMGIIVHSTAGLFKPGWNGTPVMELGNVGVLPVALYPGMRICSFTFDPLSSRARVPYNEKPDNKYNYQKEPIASLISLD